MAKFELKFLSLYDNDWTISTIEDQGGISITIDNLESSNTIYLDKSTAIKFAKTLRTEINKITESEVSNG